MIITADHIKKGQEIVNKIEKYKNKIENNQLTIAENVRNYEIIQKLEKELEELTRKCFHNQSYQK